MNIRPRAIVVLGVLAAAFALTIERGEAHKPITSKYTYNDDVFPIFRDRCGRCHVAGGVAPMSLLTYKDAFPWAESIRTELIAANMPPWNAEDGVGEIRNARTITAREIDTILTWATGGTPPGDSSHDPSPIEITHDWPLGAPDVALPLSEFSLAADSSEDTHEFTLATHTTEARWVRAVDLLPGTPAIVRSATIAVKSSPPAGAAASGTEPEQMLALWVPGQDPVPANEGSAFRLPAGAELVVRIHYKKTWKYEREAMTDRTSVGIYFAQPQATELRSVTLTPSVARAGDRGVSVSRIVDEDVQALALRADSTPATVGVQVDAVRPDGSRTAMIRLGARSGWARRYWFERPVSLPLGTRIEVVEVPGDSPPAAAPLLTRPAEGTAVRLTLDVVPAGASRTAP